MPCIVCGDANTVKSHIFPRALMHDIRGDGKHVVEASTHQQGPKFHQSGLWDDHILCRKHEQALGPLDDYGVRFCRTAMAKARPMPAINGYYAHNPKPELLRRFAVSVVWRFAVSRHGRSVELGPYEKRAENWTFEADQPDLPLIWVSLSRLKLGDRPILDFAIAPTAEKLGAIRAYSFVLGELRFHVQFDRRATPPLLTALASTSDRAIIVDGGFTDVRAIPGVAELAAKVRSSRV